MVRLGSLSTVQSQKDIVFTCYDTPVGGLLEEIGQIPAAPPLVMAGAGAGKTKTLVERCLAASPAKAPGSMNSSSSPPPGRIPQR
jgi:hypothetical protein